ncbi:PIN domain-containing protein [Thermus scotoductus]|uniref:PIN domain-containing protein n=1 Tax=Thermus scotoductus TaxID=37636 RepID=A0A430UGK4_THESC|nr:MULTISPECIES: type II toxin-antitoxin system VapC family toxin [Thermus]ETN87680.1 hypothetical protein TNMX_10960 [Thermus sp. NMX2.A1]RTH00863.1 PIN domain-containing protein [Thermus scotoductus]RTH02206.1 PIN domain-containing protein [Thermus scotoductus]RTH15977.1 PIN domain-containing protein [Thermus scotoductus]RTH17127.1 PIN domain-containing protein [Thermus scotoductus]
MRFWDASALLPLLALEAATERVQDLYLENPLVVVWWGTELELVSALARKAREGILKDAPLAKALDRLERLQRAWYEVLPGEEVRKTARRLLFAHPLRTGDALQLAAAWVASRGRPQDLPFVTLDARLAGAALREGFPVLPDPGEA